MSNNIKIYENFLSNQMKSLKIHGLISEAENAEYKSVSQEALSHLNKAVHDDHRSYAPHADRAVSTLSSHPKLQDSVSWHLNKAKENYKNRDEHYREAMKHKQQIDNMNASSLTKDKWNPKPFEDLAASMKAAQHHHSVADFHHQNAIRQLREHELQQRRERASQK